MTNVDQREVQVCTPNGVWHLATQDQTTGNLFTLEACNLDDATRLEMYPALPDWVKAVDLCKRCHPTVSER